MAVERKAITDRLKWECILFWCDVRCPECDEPILPEHDIEWDHRQALVHGGGHWYGNIRPVHVACHKAKTKRDVQANAKVKRLAKSLEQQARRNVIEIRGSDDVPGFDACVRAELAELKKQQPKGRPLKSRGFQKPPEGYKHKFGSRRI